MSQGLDTSAGLNVTMVIRSFLDYRIPLFVELDRLASHRFRLIFPAGQTPERVRRKVRDALGDRAIQLDGEWSIGTNKASRQFANRSWCIPYQPGLIRAIRQTQPDVVVGEGFFQWTLPLLYYRRRHGVPLVICYERTAHTERSAQWFRRTYRNWALKSIDAMCCNGAQSVDYAVSLGMPRERITTGFAAVDSTELATKVAQVPPDKVSSLRRQHEVTGECFLFVGQLIPRKGVRELLDGWARFESADPSGSTLVLVGDGSQSDELKQFVGQAGAKRVRFVGAIDHDQLPAYYAMASVFVMPTLEDNWAMVIPEAMACGLPVMGSQYNGAGDELVRDGENGWSFDPLKIDDVVRVLHASVSSRDEYSAMGRRSQEIVRHYTPGRAAGSLLTACQIAAEVIKA